MELPIEKVAKEFSALPSGDKLEFLKRIVIAPPGEWIELDGKFHFVPEGPPATEEEEKAFEQANAEIDAGRGVTLHELKRTLKI
ncbi:MAG TPA: hypothetical protein GX509_10825 [Firmicutes bacterium]|nr:hypothetical protein [Bacillota bacterium]HHY99219.1 hypothetical protein [Bacillota bacterium]